jgi:hypothetical protein
VSYGCKAVVGARESIEPAWIRGEGAHLERIVHDHHAFADGGLVVELVLDQGLREEGGKVRGRVPAHCVVVHVHLAQMAHHFYARAIENVRKN